MREEVRGAFRGVERDEGKEGSERRGRLGERDGTGTGKVVVSE